MNWYKMAKLENVDTSGRSITYKRCMQCRKYYTTDKNWKSNEQMDEEELIQFQQAEKATDYKAKIGVTDGVCPICLKELLASIDEE